MGYDIVISALKEDALKVLNNLEYINKYIDYKNIVFISNQEVKEMLDELHNDRIKFVDENLMIENLNFKTIKKLIVDRGGDVKRTGWYFQQFLKLGYALICEDEYYMVWDADTIPVKKVNMFNEENKPYFHLKTEYHKPYFDTIDNLFNNNYKKSVKGSFIAEHMIFKTEYVKDMLNEIEENNSIDGKYFYEKMIDAITEIKNLNNSGFSEFETYGTYVYSKYKDSYSIKEWKSLREGIYYINLPINDKQIKWLAKKYDAVSFEKHDRLSGLYKMWNNDFFYRHISINFVTRVMYPFMMLRKYIKIKK